MTGYGRAEQQLHGLTITVDLRGVNNRFLDCAVRLPRSYLYVEDKIKAEVQRIAARGKIDVFLSVKTEDAQQVQVRVNQAVAQSYTAALRELADCCALAWDISLTQLSSFPDVLTLEKAEEDSTQITEDFIQVVSLALEDFEEMRIREGERLRRDILGRADTIEALVSRVEERSPQTVSEYRAKLEERMREVLEGVQLDPARILTEAAIFADKVAVDEETVRLRSHLHQLREMLEKGGVIGRKLDFLIQEFNREANTIGSKCSDLELTRLVVDMKAEIEKIREQVQNIE